MKIPPERLRNKLLLIKIPTELLQLWKLFKIILHFIRHLKLFSGFHQTFHTYICNFTFDHKSILLKLSLMSKISSRYKWALYGRQLKICLTLLIFHDTCFFSENFHQNYLEIHQIFLIIRIDWLCTKSFKLN